MSVLTTFIKMTITPALLWRNETKHDKLKVVLYFRKIIKISYKRNIFNSYNCKIEIN
jgi:hypothetical protein